MRIGLNKFFAVVAALIAFCPAAEAQIVSDSSIEYVPTKENIVSRQEFADAGFGIFLHWGIYSMFAQGEWYLNRQGVLHEEYAKAAGGFYPAGFDAKEWVSAFKKAGAKYICFTTRHHDGFSMFATKYSPYNIVEATPWGKDVLKELADECHRQGIRLHLYYSLVDWGRDDYPMGRTGQTTGKDKSKADWNSYCKFMTDQLTELLTNYGEIGAIWFDGVWDHDTDATVFDWQMRPIYDHIHSLQPSCLVANNHHLNVSNGEDIQVFERDLPGENKGGYSGNMDISVLPLETCETMNGIWGYRITDQNYKSLEEIVRLLVGAAGKGANLLLNIGPQADGRLPEVALQRLEQVGTWLAKYGETIYATTAGDVPVQSWGATTRKGDRLFVHVWDDSLRELFLPIDAKVKSAKDFASGEKVKYDRCSHGVHLILPQKSDTTSPERVIELQLR